MSDVTIESHEDEGVTVTVGSITAHIRGDSWKDANDAAHVLAGIVTGAYEAVEIRRQLTALRATLREMETMFDSVERHMVHVVNYADFVRRSTDAQNKEKR